MIGRTLSFGSVLFFVLLVLKLTGVIALSWVWVAAPLWIPVAGWAAMFLISVVFLRVVGGKK